MAVRIATFSYDMVSNDRIVSYDAQQLVGQASTVKKYKILGFSCSFLRDHIAYYSSYTTNSVIFREAMLFNYIKTHVTPSL
jgi:hypothetical protein